ncbi:PilZ domain-containing protein [Nitratiruptor sp. SB155-2]|uniref:PilZ domain-containing protein n=1 Tax=Nitratiruptor sp. (strain SB155-2) TaxID=387092 RepID=UPI0001586F8C|nr:PilZ domain-containing protein [Nitratiruptor sp. SB155-2]BAF69303.1 conserved hypothetical protein [Nitratiruptor sp. SB155-2]
MNRENKEKLAKQIMHEAEVTRQFARYKIPAKVEIDGKIYVVDNWSLGGLAIKNAPKEFCQKPMRKGKMIFKYDTFETVVDNLNLEFICTGKRAEGDHYPLLGAKFHNLEDYQISILNQIITAYINGDIITKEDILYAVTRQITYPKKEEKKLNKKRADKLLILIYTVIFLLLSFLGYIAYYRTFVVQTANAYVDGNITVIRAPFLSYIHFTKTLHRGDNIEINQTIAIARFIDGEMQPIISPLNGTVLKVNVLENEFRNTAEPVVTVLQKDTAPYIIAKMDHKFFKKVKVGYIAKVRTQDDQIFEAKVVKIEPAQPVDLEKAKILANIYNRPRDYDTLYLEPTEPIDISLINTTVYVTIDTFWQ